MASYGRVVFSKPSFIALYASVNAEDNQKAAEQHHNVKLEAEYVLEYLFPNDGFKHLLPLLTTDDQQQKRGV